MFESALAFLGSNAAGLSGAGDLLSGISSLAGGLFGGSSASSSKRWTNHWNRVQYEWQQELARSGVQMRAADLDKAGLNPILAAAGGGVGTAGQAGGFHPGAPPSRAEHRQRAIEAAASALQLKRLPEDIKLVKNQQKVAEAQDTNLGADTWSKYMTADYMDQLRKRTKSETHLTDVEAKLKELYLPAARNSARAESSFWKREIAPYLGDVSTVAGSARQARDAGAPYNPIRRHRSESFFYRGD